MTRCAGRVPDPHGWRSHQCTRKGSVLRGDDWYCGAHDPEAQRARKDASHQKWHAESQYKTARGTIVREAVNYAASGDDAGLRAAVAEFIAARDECSRLGIAKYKLL